MIEDKLLYKEFLIKKVENQMAEENLSITLKTGYSIIDDNVGGLRSGQLFYLCARPAIGKTTFMTNILYNILETKQLGENDYILFLSLESTPLEVIKKLVALKEDKEIKETINSCDFGQKAKKFIEQNNIIIYNCKDNGSYFDISQLGKILQNFYADNKHISSIFIDYFSLLDPNDGKRQQHERLSKISGTLKNIALKYNVNIFSLAQLSREYEKRASKSPTLADIKGSGSLEQDGDVIAFLYDKNTEAEENGKYLFLTIAKNRNGSTPTKNLIFDLSKGKISEMITPFRKIKESVNE